MISRRRSGPTAAAMSIECTTSAKSTVTCLYSAWLSAATFEPHASQNRAPSRSSAPHEPHDIATGYQDMDLAAETEARVVERAGQRPWLMFRRSGGGDFLEDRPQCRQVPGVQRGQRGRWWIVDRIDPPHGLATRFGEGDQLAAPIGGIGRADDEPPVFQVVDRDRGRRCVH